MDFDHINPDKKDSNVGRLVWGLTPWDKVLAEIEKCDLVCANCHRLRTYKGGNRPLTHLKHSDKCKKVYPLCRLWVYL
jgi:hypothetical protein